MQYPTRRLASSFAQLRPLRPSNRPPRRSAVTHERDHRISGACDGDVDYSEVDRYRGCSRCSRPCAGVGPPGTEADHGGACLLSVLHERTHDPGERQQRTFTRRQVATHYSRAAQAVLARHMEQPLSDSLTGVRQQSRVAEQRLRKHGTPPRHRQLGQPWAPQAMLRSRAVGARSSCASIQCRCADRRP